MPAGGPYRECLRRRLAAGLSHSTTPVYRMRAHQVQKHIVTMTLARLVDDDDHDLLLYPLDSNIIRDLE